MDSLQTHIAHDLQDAYYELIAYSVKAARAMNEKVLGSRLSFIYAALGDKTSAMKYSEISRKGYEKIQNLTEKYNKETAKGKWDGMMDYAPRGLRHFYAFKTATEATWRHHGQPVTHHVTAQSSPPSNMQKPTNG